MIQMIQIRKNTAGDSRTAEQIPSITEFNKANSSHRHDVMQLMGKIGNDIIRRGEYHDYTKTDEPGRSMFYRDLCGSLEKWINFTDGEWYKMHCTVERHHLDRRCPEDVNLIDVIEMVCDSVCAGLTRTGEVRPINISSEILERAVANTVKLCTDAVQVID